MRSDMVTKGVERSPHRGLLRATGLTDADFGKPLIGIANSYADIVPGHVHLARVGRLVKQAVREAGGVPFEFNTIAICDGIAMGHAGMKYSLPSRELIADCVETMVEAHRFDGMVCIPNCDKIIPGMLMAAARVDIPAVFVSGGPMATGRLPDGRPCDLITIFQGIGRHAIGAMDERELESLERSGCPTCGSCSGLFTANSMNCIMEALGAAFPGNGTVLAADPARDALYLRAGRRILDLVREDVRFRTFLTEASFDNAFALDIAMGGSTNTILHLLAIAEEAGLPYDLRRIGALAGRVPTLCKVSPSSPYHMDDVGAAGGMSAILKELTRVDGVVHAGAPTVGGVSLGDAVAPARIADPACIRPIENAYSATGGLAVLYGSLAPEGAVVKTAGVDPAMLVHAGPAVIFESQEDACEGILAGKVKPGDVVVIRYEGPKGGPGMQEMLSPTSYIKGMNLGDKCALITDGRFSGGTAGACIGHISPEAAEGGPIGLLRNGDVVALDIPGGRLDVKLAEAELAARRTRWTPPPPRTASPWLRRYAAFATSASRGAVMRRL
ncbi:MAG TPA: dihydroxy-acid dehydratase [Planctomycetes bacterium]|nr:dihydroxy-acid dehydratase [Planctomycetota bacterium]